MNEGGRGIARVNEDVGWEGDSLSTMETMPQRLPLPRLESDGDEETGKSLSVTKSRCELAARTYVGQCGRMGGK